MTDGLTDMTFDALIEAFDLFDDWEDRYRYVIDLGRKLPEMPASLKTEANKVQGCLSQVWLVPVVDDHDPGTPPRLRFLVDSDAHIVRGLAAVMMVLFSGKTAAEILDLDADAALRRLDLDSHISPNRRNGVASMVGRIKDLARLAQGA